MLYFRSRYKALVSRDSRDCGATVLATVLLQHGYRVSKERLKQLVLTDLHGTSLAALRDTAIHLGFDASAGRARPASLSDLPAPFIAHVLTQSGGHFVAVHKVSSRSVLIADPMFGLLTISRDDFDRQWTGSTLLLRPTDTMRLEQVQPPRVGAELRTMLLKQPGMVALNITALILFNSCALLLSWLLGRYFNAVLGLQPTHISQLFLVVCAALVGRLVFSSMHSYCSSLYGARLEQYLGLRYLNHLLTLPLSFFDTRPSGDLINRLYDVARIRIACLNAGSSLVLDFATMLCVAIWLFRVTAVGAVVVLLFLGVVLFVIRRAAFGTVNVYRLLQQEAGSLQESLVEVLGGMRTLRALSAEGSAGKLLGETFSSYLRARHRAEVAVLRVHGPLQILTSAASALILMSGTYAVSRGRMLPGSLVMEYAVGVMLLASVERASASLATIEDASVSADALFDTLLLPAEVPLKREYRFSSSPSVLKAADIAFAHPRGRTVLHSCSLKLVPGELVCLLGESGSGKSTLAAILAGLLKPASGLVSIETAESEETTYFPLRKHVLLVSGDSGLISGTIFHNLELGINSVEQDEMTRACVLAGAHEFILKMPLGYNTEVGARGSLLSTGQRQRLTLARSFLRDPSILILDEATSGLDPQGEGEVLANLKIRRASLSTLFITHRLTTAMRADRCIVLDGGRIVQDGRPHNLAMTSGPFDNMLRAAGFAEREA